MVLCVVVRVRDNVWAVCGYVTSSTIVRACIYCFGLFRTEGRFFYGMPESGASQWIYTHPEDGAPRTGEGIFPMEVVEVVQVGGRTDAVIHCLRSR